FCSFAVLCFFCEMHGNGCPCDGTAASDLQIFARGERTGNHVGEKILLHAFAVLLPTVVGEGRDVVEDEASILGVKLRGFVRVEGAPGGTVVVDELAEVGGVRSLLLCACADERKQRANERESDVKKPAPVFDLRSGTRSGRRSHPNILQRE